MQRLDRYLIAFVVTHFAVTVVHAVGHFALQILPAGFDLVYVVGVITVGPMVALPVLRFNRSLGAALVAVLMGGSFVYGFYSHFIAAGPDNVSLVPAQPGTVMFVATAALLGVLEAFAAAIAVALFRSAARTPSELAGPPA